MESYSIFKKPSHIEEQSSNTKLIFMENQLGKNMEIVFKFKKSKNSIFRNPVKTAAVVDNFEQLFA
jgi:hypothetical protein